MMGRTHGVHAEPTTFGVKMALWYTEMKRNLKRFKEVRKEIEVRENEWSSRNICQYSTRN